MDYSWQVLVTVFTFGGVGAVVRAAILQILMYPSAFLVPLGVLFVNILAALTGGLIVAMALPQDIHLALVIGLVGGVGTLSAFTTDLIALWEDRSYRKRSVFLLAYIGLTTLFGIFCAQGGMSIGHMMRGTVASTVSAQDKAHLEQYLKDFNLNLDGSAIAESRPTGRDALAPASALEQTLPDAPTAPAAPAAPERSAPENQLDHPVHAEEAQ